MELHYLERSLPRRGPLSERDKEKPGAEKKGGLIERREWIVHWSGPLHIENHGRQILGSLAEEGEAEETLEGYSTGGGGWRKSAIASRGAIPTLVE